MRWRAAIDSRTKAVLVVSPNNPTGSTLDRRELAALARLAASREVALIGDEVFADYRLTPAAAGVSVLQQSQALAFGLGGLSKSVGLPQVKVAWIGVVGTVGGGGRCAQRPRDRGRHVSLGVDAGATGAR